jgi:hypothetical protein
MNLLNQALRAVSLPVNFTANYLAKRHARNMLDIWIKNHQKGNYFIIERVTELLR